MTDKIYILATDEVADECVLLAMNWHLQHPKYKKVADERATKIAIASVSEYLANQKGFTMYTDVADYPKVKK